MTLDEIRKLVADERSETGGITTTSTLCDVVDALLAVIDALPKCGGDGAACDEIAMWSNGACDHHRYRTYGLPTEQSYAAALRALARKP